MVEFFQPFHCSLTQRLRSSLLPGLVVFGPVDANIVWRVINTVDN